MPISAQQWRAMVGSNNIRRHHQVGVKNVKQPERLTKKSSEETVTHYHGQDSNCFASTSCTVSSVVSTKKTALYDSDTFTFFDCVIFLMPRATTTMQMLQCIASLLAILLLLLAGDVETNPGPGTILTVDDLRTVNKAVFEIRAKWYPLGIELGIHTGTLDSVKTRCMAIPEDCLRELLTEWLKTEKPTWVTLVEALQSEILGESNLAARVERDHCKRTQTDEATSEEQNGIPDMGPCDDADDEECVSGYAEHLKVKYQKQALPAEGLLEHSKEICKLAMIQNEKLRRHEISDEFVQQTITGKVDDILHMKIPIELKSIFKDVPKDKKIVLVEGAPGAGKSSLSLNICKKWSRGELFQKYKLVILVRLRDPRVQAAKSIAELLPHCEKTTSLSVQSAILKANGESVLWVLDGWDEFPDHLKKDDVNCLVTNLICKQNHNSSVLVTSRPISSVKLYPLVSKRVEILGFTSDELKRYFEYRLKDEADAKSVETLLKKIEQYPEVQSSCYLPLHAGFIADTFLMKKQELPSTQYGIFETVVVKCISRHQIKQNKKEINSLKDLTDDLQKNFSAICELAYIGILNNKIIFTESDLPSDFKSLDLLQEVESMVAFQGGVSKTYNFLHLSVQEFLAAQHLARKPLYEQYWLFRGLMEDDRCLPMLTFYAAKTKLCAPGVVEFVSKVGNRYLQAKNEQEEEQLCGLLAFVFKCICETEDSHLCKPLVAALSKKFFRLHLIYDYYAFGSFLSLSSGAEMDNYIPIGIINRLLIQDHDWNLLIRGLSRFFKPDKCITMLKVGTLKVLASDPILGVLKNKPVVHVSNLYIFNSEYDRNVYDVIDRRRHSTPPTMTTLRSEYPNQLGTCLKGLIGQGMVGNLKIKQISILSCEMIAEGVKLSTGLSELHLVNCGISCLDCEVICRGLFNNKALKVLNLSLNAIGKGIKDISDVLCSNTSINCLILYNCKITLQFLTLMKGVGNVKTLVFSRNNIGDEGAKFLTSILQNNEHIQTLALNNCRITSNGSGCLLTLIQRDKLKTLQISSRFNRNNVEYSYVTFSGELDNEDYSYPYMRENIPDHNTWAEAEHYKSRSHLHAYNHEWLLHIPVGSKNTDMLCQIITDPGCHLQTLIITANDLAFDFKSITVIFEALKKNTSIEYFRIKDGYISTENLKVLGDVLTVNKIVATVIIDVDLKVNVSLDGAHVPILRAYGAAEDAALPRDKSKKLKRAKSIVPGSSNIKSQPVVVHATTELTSLAKYLAFCLSKNNTLRVLRLPHQCDTKFLQELRYQSTFISRVSNLSILDPSYQSSGFFDKDYDNDNL